MKSVYALNWFTAVFFALSPFSLVAEDSTAPALPDLPQVTTQPDFSKSSAPLPSTSTTSPIQGNMNAQPQRANMTEEQLKQAQKDKNWLSEGLKDRNAATEEELRRTQSETPSVIDQMLEKNRQLTVSDTNNNNPLEKQPQVNRGFQAAITTSAWEPLPEIQAVTTPGGEIKSGQGSTANQPTWKAYDEATGVANVFYNPSTGTFDSQPPSAQNNTRAPQPAWITASATTADPMARQALEREAQLLRQAGLNTAVPSATYNPSIQPQFTAPQPGGPISTSSGPPANPFQQTQADLQQDTSNQMAVAKLRMLEEERARQDKNQRRPKIADIHSPLRDNRIDLNPRF
ncbi:MAG: hypothetical protein ACFCUX_10335 [Candidatus Methylacidiphilales bacterium]